MEEKLILVIDYARKHNLYWRMGRGIMEEKYYGWID